MQFSSRVLLLKAVLLAVAILPAGTVNGQGQKKVISKDVSFNTFDGVKLSGTLYPNPAGKRDAVVLLLHHFDLKNGGGQSQPGWSELAKSLHEDGYTVLSFDFRGFGESKTINSNFWTFGQNTSGLIRGSVKKGEVLDHKNFTSGYLRYLVNDVAAAKAYLDRRNDAKELNSSNLILIGAGDGAAVGAMWLANECYRRRDTNVPPNRFGPALTSESEIGDVACAVWLSLSPKVGPTAGVNRWCLLAGKKHKVPMAFVHAKGDVNGKTLADSYIKALKPATGGKVKEVSSTGAIVIDGVGKLTGNRLLTEGDTIPRIKKYLDVVLNTRGSKEQKDRKSEASQYWYVWPLNPAKAKIISKRAGQEAPQVDVQSLTGN